MANVPPLSLFSFIQGVRIGQELVERYFTPHSPPAPTSLRGIEILTAAVVSYGLNELSLRGVGFGRRDFGMVGFILRDDYEIGL